MLEYLLKNLLVELGLLKEKVLKQLNHAHPNRYACHLLGRNVKESSDECVLVFKIKFLCFVAKQTETYYYA